MRCPICNREFDPQQSNVLPFCSSRCQQVDLSRWLGESYGLPHVSDEDEEMDSPPHEMQRGGGDDDG
jgi:endogenous inhibitor of DNA gyrase (YacG/DUF329 family)